MRVPDATDGESCDDGDDGAHPDDAGSVGADDGEDDDGLARDAGRAGGSARS